jgi:hypothetical protein
MTQALVLASNASLMTTPSGTAPGYMARAWVNFNGTGTVAIRASGNVSSITDNGTGDYTVNFTTAMSDANYVMTGTASYSNSSGTNGRTVNTSTMNSANCRITTAYAANTLEDEQFIQVAIFR